MMLVKDATTGRLTLDGNAVTGAAKSWLGRLFTLIREANPTRPPGANLQRAVVAFRLTAKPTDDDGWTVARTYRSGGISGRPILLKPDN